MPSTASAAIASPNDIHEISTLADGLSGMAFIDQCHAVNPNQAAKKIRKKKKKPAQSSSESSNCALPAVAMADEDAASRPDDAPSEVCNVPWKEKGVSCARCPQCAQRWIENPPDPSCMPSSSIRHAEPANSPWGPQGKHLSPINFTTASHFRTVDQLPVGNQRLSTWHFLIGEIIDTASAFLPMSQAPHIKIQHTDGTIGLCYLGQTAEPDLLKMNHTICAHWVNKEAHPSGYTYCVIEGERMTTVIPTTLAKVLEMNSIIVTWQQQFPGRCWGCREGGRTFNCVRCNVAVFCSKECQLAHWPEHKKHCKGMVFHPLA